MIINPTSTSYATIYENLLKYVLAKPDSDKFIDTYLSGVGVTQLELLAGLAEFFAYHSTMVKRETYLQEALQRTSNIGIAQTLGYSVFRGKNDHLSLTVVPSTDTTIKKYTVIGSVLGYDLVSLDTVSLNYEKPVTIRCVVGTLKQEIKSISTNKISRFRFTSPKVTEDICLYLNSTEVPIHTEYLKLDDDYYVVISNPNDSVDVFYLNRDFAKSWNSNTLYSYKSAIIPSYTARRSFTYSVGQVCVPVKTTGYYYKCIQAGITAKTTPATWTTVPGLNVYDGTVIWQCIGPNNKQYYYENVVSNTVKSGSVQPVWSMTLGDTITDGDCVWVCTDNYKYSRYPYKSGDKLILKYIEDLSLTYNFTDLNFFYGEISSTVLDSEYVTPESRDNIKINAPLYHETEKVIRGRNDYKKIFKQITPGVVQTNGHDVSPAVVELSYVKNHTTSLWSPNKIINLGTRLMPSVPNGYIYESDSEGRTLNNTSSTTTDTEPTWPTTLGQTVVENRIVWECVSNTPTSVLTWTAQTKYTVDTVVNPILSTGFLYKVKSIIAEPVWPTTIGETVIDNTITWTCVDNIYLKGYSVSEWQDVKKYSLYESIVPIVSTGFFYTATDITSSSGTVEPTWTEELNTEVVDNDIVWYPELGEYDEDIVWEASTDYTKDSIVCPSVDNGFVYKVKTLSGYSSSTYPTFPITLEEQVLDGDITWECTDYLDSTKYTKNNSLSELSSYIRPFGIMPPVITDPEIVYIVLDITVRLLETKEKVQVISDIEDILENYERVLGNTFITEDIENSLKPIDYVKISRIEITSESKSLEWESGKLYKITDSVIPTTPNGFIYEMAMVKGGGETAYSQWETKGYSNSEEEPDWPEVLGNTVSDGVLVWTCVELAGTPEDWNYNTLYEIGMFVKPTTANGFMYELTSLSVIEPNWPTTDGALVTDSKVWWICRDPKVNAPKCNWNEYYIINFNLELI